MSAGELLVDDAKNLWRKHADGSLEYAGKQGDAATASPSSSGADYAQGAKRGVTRGLLTGADMAMETGDTPLALGGVPFIVKQLMGRDFSPSERVLKALELDKKPEGKGARYAEEGIAGAVGGLTTGGRHVAASAVSGAAGGLGGEAAANLFGDNPISRVVGSMLSSLGGYGAYSAATGSRARTRINTLAKDIPDRTFDEMAAGVKNAKEQGVKIAAHQATSERTPLSTVASEVGNSPAAGPKQGLDLEAQAGQAKGAAERLLGMMSGYQKTQPSNPLFIFKDGRGEYGKGIDAHGNLLQDAGIDNQDFAAIAKSGRIYVDSSGDAIKIIAGKDHYSLPEVMEAAKRFVAKAVPEKPVMVMFDDKQYNVPSPRVNPVEAAHGAQRAATKAVNAADQDLSNSVKPLYETDLNKLKDFDKRRAGLVKAIFAESDPATDHGKHLKQLASAINKAKTPEQLNAIYNEWNQGLQQNKLNGKSVVDFAAGEIRNKGLSKLDRFLASVQVDRVKAQDDFQYAQSRVIDPLRRSPVGQLAGRSGIQEDVPTATARLLKVLDNPDVRAQTILDTQKTLDAQAPGTFAKLAAAAFEKKIEAAFKGREGQTPFEAPADLAQAVWGGPKQTAARENFRATMAGVARSNGLSGVQEAEFVKGAEKIMQAIEAAGREKTVAHIPHGKSAAAEAVKGGVGSAIYTPQAPGAVARTMEAASGHRAAKALYELLWSGPEGVEKIRKYARMSIPEIRTSALAGAVSAAHQQSHAQEK